MGCVFAVDAILPGTGITIRTVLQSLLGNNPNNIATYCNIPTKNILFYWLLKIALNTCFEFSNNTI
jgi:hypothetical protein